MMHTSVCFVVVFFFREDNEDADDTDGEEEPFGFQFKSSVLTLRRFAPFCFVTIASVTSGFNSMYGCNSRFNN